MIIASRRRESFHGDEILHSVTHIYITFRKSLYDIFLSQKRIKYYVDCPRGEGRHSKRSVERYEFRRRLNLREGSWKQTQNRPRTRSAVSLWDFYSRRNDAATISGNNTQFGEVKSDSAVPTYIYSISTCTAGRVCVLSFSFITFFSVHANPF